MHEPDDGGELRVMGVERCCRVVSLWVCGSVGAVSCCVSLSVCCVVMRSRVVLFRGGLCGMESLCLDGYPGLSAPMVVMHESSAHFRVDSGS